jgi:pimeloyl-ACP methyl ester carboxylesterase
MGAVVSAMFAAKFPERVAGLILIEPVLVPKSVRLLRWLPFRASGNDLASRAARRRDRFESFEAALASYRGRGAFKTWPEAFLRAYLEGGLLPSGRGSELRLACAPAWEAQTFRASPIGAARVARKIRCPVTLLYAEGSTTAPERECRTFARLHGQTRLVEVPETTHFLPMERPGIVRREILAMAG